MLRMRQKNAKKPPFQSLEYADLAGVIKQHAALFFSSREPSHLLQM